MQLCSSKVCGCIFYLLATYYQGQNHVANRNFIRLQLQGLQRSACSKHVMHQLDFASSVDGIGEVLDWSPRLNYPCKFPLVDKKVVCIYTVRCMMVEQYGRNCTQVLPFRFARKGTELITDGLSKLHISGSHQQRFWAISSLLICCRSGFHVQIKRNHHNRVLQSATESSQN